MKDKIALLFAVLAVSAFVQVQGERLVWADEFNHLDLKKWAHMVTGWGGGNGEFQYYRNNRKNSFVRGGKLFIRPTQTVAEIRDLNRGRIAEPGCNMQPCVIQGGGDIINPFFSAKLVSRHSFSVKYGRIEIRAKLPAGDWLWPAIWMLPTDNVYGGWPRSGEIDIVEARGNPDLKSPDGRNHGNVAVGSTLHFGPAWNNKAMINRAIHAPPGKSWSTGFHKYEFIWRHDRMKFLVDGQVINDVGIPAGGFRFNPDIYKGKAKNAPFDQRFHFMLTVAVGGEFFPLDWKSAGRPRPWRGGDNRRQFWNSRGSWLHTWGNPDRHSMEIDYIRVYQH